MHLLLHQPILLLLLALEQMRDQMVTNQVMAPQRDIPGNEAVSVDETLLLELM